MPNNKGRNNYNNGEKKSYNPYDPDKMQGNKKRVPAKKKRPTPNQARNNTRPATANVKKKRPGPVANGNGKKTRPMANASSKPRATRPTNGKPHSGKSGVGKKNKGKKNKFTNQHPKLMMALKIMIVLF